MSGWAFYFLKQFIIFVLNNKNNFTMKNYILIALIAFSINACLPIGTVNAQITLEHTYNNTGWCKGAIVWNNSVSYGQHQFYLVHLEIDGDKYVDIDKMAQTISFYDLSHTFWKSINYSSVPTNISPYSNNDKAECSILYISQSLFNTDPKIEFMYAYDWYNEPDSAWRATTQIVNEDGTILFSDSAAPLVQPAWADQYYPIYNTSEGTKMILSNVKGTAEVFSLAGHFTNSIAQNNILGNAAQMSLFPNPSSGGNMVTINYKLPEEIKTANLLVFDSQGKQVKSYKIGNGMSNILVNASEFSKGTYFYSIITNDGKVIASKKSIVIE